MKLTVLFVGLLALVLSVEPTRAGGPGGRPIYDPSRNPASDLAAAMAEAHGDGKRILLEVGGNWCGWCREFERFVRSDRQIQDELACAFVVVRVNVSPENRNERFLAQYPEISGYPYIFLLDAHGSLMRAVDSDNFLRGEVYDRRKFLALLRTWALPAVRP